LCLKDLGAFDLKLEEIGFGVLPPGGYGMSAPSGYYGYSVAATPRQKIRSLRDAAYVYARDGDEESCQLVLNSMRRAFEQHQELAGPGADDSSLRAAWRRAHLANAQPTIEMSRLMRADIVIGADIRNSEDERLGEIEDVVIDPAKSGIAYVLVSRGGFLGLGEKLVAVRWKDLRVTEDHELYVLDVGTSAFDEAPAVDRAMFEKTADLSWREELDRFWEENLER
jgi:sporulation protein YlmC with PRC-barrel domain